MSKHADWLAHVELDGLVISEPVIEEQFPGGPLQVPKGIHSWFRRRAERYRVAQAQSDPRKRGHGVREWIDFLLEDLLEMPRTAWRKSHEIPDGLLVSLPEFEQELRPDRVLMRKDHPALLVSIVDPTQSLDRKDKSLGRWKASPTTKLERLLRETDNPLGLVTNGEDHRLVYARPGLNSGSITWTSRVLIEEKAALDAFFTLLGRDVLLPSGDDALTLADLCRISQDRQGEVADQLGVQVRSGLEQLIWSWDEANRASDGELLRDMTPDQLYEMGLVLMMRLVFLLYAEERDLLPHGEVLYDQGYGLTYLWHRLSQQHHEDAARLDQTRDAWDRFLATCRFVHGGCKHPDLSLIPYGGSLFDPRRYPVLEKPDFRVSNRTFYEVMRLLLFARQRKGGEPQRVGYWSISVEQIGYIYEGLLDHRCARAGDVPMVKLRGGGEEAYPITDLESREGDALVKFFAEKTGRKEDSLQTALGAEPDPKDAKALQQYPAAVVERVAPYANVIQCGEVAPPGWYYLTTGTSRRASGAHYTPETLTERIVRVTLEPLVYRNVEDKPGLLVDPREVKTARELLDLKVCDIAMGSGAFLVQAVRYLGDRVVEAWDRAIARAHEKDEAAVLSMPYAEAMTDSEADRAIDPEKRVEMELWARRYVVERCIYGVDVNPLAVEMAKLSLWLTTLARDRPFTFLDHALKCGDSLVGVDREQLLSWSIDRANKDQPIPPVFQAIVKGAVDKALELRRQLQVIPVVEAADLDKKAALLERANQAMDRVRVAGDLLVVPSFTEGSAKQRAELRDQFLSKVVAASSVEQLTELRREADRLLGDQKSFHWLFEFPEVFMLPGREGFNAVVGNPPFLWGNRISSTLGDRYRKWLMRSYSGTHGNADLCVYFLRRGFKVLTASGHLGLVTTNSIRETDSRESGLAYLVNTGATIYAASPDRPWPGGANVRIAYIHLTRGAHFGKRLLDGLTATSISPSLKEAAPQTLRRLARNADQSFKGVDFGGTGFILTESERRELLRENPEENSSIWPLLNAADVTSSPTQEPARWIINFTDLTFEDAQRMEACFKVVIERVKPYRSTVKRKANRLKWWLYNEPRPGLYRAIAGLQRVLVNPVVAKWISFAFAPPRTVFTNVLNVYPVESTARFAMLQSSLHVAWALEHASTMRVDPRYNPTDCYETYPFPTDDETPELRSLGSRYHSLRAEIMGSRGAGLTDTYNRFHDPSCKEPGIQRLRELHVDMDLAVRDAYGWTELDLEHDWVKTVTTEEKKDKKTGKIRAIEKEDWRFTISERAKQDVLRRLLDLNHRYYQEEVEQGLHDKKDKTSKKAKPPKEKDKKPLKFGAKPAPPAQVGLFGADHGPLFPVTYTYATPPEAPDTTAGISAEGDGGELPDSAVLDFLRANPDWHSKDEIVSATALPANRWTKAIKTLLDAGTIEKQGEKRGTKYRAT